MSSVNESDRQSVPVQALRDFAANPAFRSAEGYELLLENPYHRPVRSNDLAFIDFGTPLTPDRAFELSALMAHRMLLNVHEAEFSFLPAAPTAAIDADRAAFYSVESRTRGERIRPFLERHAFGWVRALAEKAGNTNSLQSLRDRISARIEDWAPDKDGVLRMLGGTTGRERAARLVVIQFIGPMFSKELAIARGVAVNWPDPAPALNVASPSPHALFEPLRSLARSAGLADRLHEYWQFYLGSSIGVANFLHALAREPRDFPAYVGAVMCDRLRMAFKADAYREVLGSAIGGLDDRYFSLFTGDRAMHCDAAVRMAGDLAARLGEGSIAAVGRGFEELAALYAAADADITTQLEWMDDPPRYEKLARGIYSLIQEQHLPVELETYVEEVTERSTTHVHDTDRLLVIETGEMDFWNSFGTPHHFSAGNMIYVPRHRLHGSVVTSERCIYHQPIVTAALHHAYRSASLPS